jgi:hypothetical protein
MWIAKRAGPPVLFALAIALLPACGEETGHPPRASLENMHGCLNQKERRALVESGGALRLAVAMHAVRGHLPGTLVGARLCHRGDGLVYVLTVLAHDGKVTRLAVDAVKGTLVGGH